MAAILIVEDDKLLGRVLRDLLSDAGYKAFWADSIDSAKITLDAKEIHMVYLDLNLNNENGMHLLNYIK